MSSWGRFFRPFEPTSSPQGGLGVGLPPCRQTDVKYGVVKRVRCSREGGRARRDDVVHNLSCVCV